MKSRITTLLSLTLPLCAFGCSHDQQPARTSGYEPAMTPAARSAPSAPAQLGSEPSERLDDAQITTIARAVNSAEVDQAKIAIGKAKNESVKNFAQSMIAEHGQAVQQIDELNSRFALPEADSQLVTELRVSATRMDNQLTALDDGTFDKRYILGQIDEHRQVLDTIDSRLLPAARRDEIKQMLQGMRPRVQHHLEMAQTILGTIK